MSEDINDQWWADAERVVKTTPVLAKRVIEGGEVVTERGPMAYAPGDWMLRTTIEPLEMWPISDDYFKANYASEAVEQAWPDHPDMKRMLDVARDERQSMREALEHMVCQFGYWSGGANPGLTSGGLSALEDAFEALGWDEPHYVKEMECDEPGCTEQNSAGWPSPRGYRHTCHDHYRTSISMEDVLAAAREGVLEGEWVDRGDGTMHLKTGSWR